MGRGGRQIRIARQNGADCGSRGRAGDGVDREEYNERVTSDVVETARQALFAETLAVRLGDREAFESWRAEYPGEVRVAGSDNVDRVAWHVSPIEQAVAATFANEPDAAVGTVRRMAFNRLYRDRLVGADRDE